jgi:signal transduction histidine kinase
MKDYSVSNRKQIFLLLMLFRWLTFIPPLAAFFLAPTETSAQIRMIAALSAAILINSIISLRAVRLNDLIKIHPWILLIDLFFVSLIMAVTGGWRSPYYLYALSPILVAAFFFQVRGALTAISILVPCYFGAIIIDITRFDGTDPEWMVVIVFTIGLVLMGITVGYVSQLLDELQSTQRTLYRRHQELQVLHDFGNSLQLSTSIDDVELHVLVTLTKELGFSRAIIGLIDLDSQIINRWRDSNTSQGDSGNHRDFEPISLADEDNIFSQAMQKQESIRTSHSSPRSDRSKISSNNESQPPGIAASPFELSESLLLPMHWGIKPIGVLLIDVENYEQDSIDLAVLEAIARQTAVTLGMMITRLRHAKESAVQEERTRIALDLHDTISQSLFGLVYTLQGCLKLLPEDPRKIEPELEWALATAQDVHRKIRTTIHNIWPQELTAKQFEEDLRIYAADVLQAADLNITFDIRGEFNTLSPPVRRGMYRICQESLTNIVHHASAHQSRICVDVADGRARIILRDNGRGFEPDIAFAQDFEADHFGIRGMRERAAALGGTCEIYSQPGAGTSILIDIPANVQAHHE